MAHRDTGSLHLAGVVSQKMVDFRDLSAQASRTQPRRGGEGDPVNGKRRATIPLSFMTALEMWLKTKGNAQTFEQNRNIRHTRIHMFTWFHSCPAAARTECVGFAY